MTTKADQVVDRAADQLQELRVEVRTGVRVFAVGVGTRSRPSSRTISRSGCLGATSCAGSAIVSSARAGMQISLQIP